MSGREVYIVDCVRVPIARGYPNGAYFGKLYPIDLLARVLSELMVRTKVDKSLIDDVIAGCVTPIGDQGADIGRLAALKAGFPQHVPGVQLNRLCGSAQQAVHFAAQAIAAGDYDVAIGCGIEMMSTVKMGTDFVPTDFAKLQSEMPFKLLHQGVSAELIAEKWNITRDEMDEFAARSHALAHEAIQKGYFKSQLLPVVDSLQNDEGIRHPSDMTKMKKLPTPFKANGRITPAHASQVSDGAAAVLLCSAEKLAQLKLVPKARIVARVVIGSDPELMLTGPIAATRLALKKAGLKLEDIDLFEINEAFASVVLAWQKELKIPSERVNVNGGAIAHGHPLGATGAILITKLVYELQRTGKRYGLMTMCIGWGMGTATIIENYAVAKAKSKM